MDIEIATLSATHTEDLIGVFNCETAPSPL